jgi:hypothetical protein
MSWAGTRTEGTSRAGNWTAGAGTKTRPPDETLTRLAWEKMPYESDRKGGGQVSKKAGPLWPWANVAVGAGQFGPDDAKLKITRRAVQERSKASDRIHGNDARSIETQRGTASRRTLTWTRRALCRTGWTETTPVVLS